MKVIYCAVGLLNVAVLSLKDFKPKTLPSKLYKGMKSLV